MITRKVEYHRGFGNKELGIVVKSVLKDNDRLYYHCCSCGIVFDDPNYTKPLIDVLRLTGRYDLPKTFNAYQVTSGICNPCFDILMPGELEKKLR